MPMPDAIIFDFDGVLVDSVNIKTEAFAELYRPHGEEVARQVAAYQRAHGGMTRHAKIRHFGATLLGRAPTDAEVDALAARMGALVEEKVTACPMIAGARDFLDRHHARVRLFVASATPEAELRRIVAGRGLAPYFRGVHGSPTPKDRVVAQIVRAAALDPARTVMVGDAEEDRAAAAASGVPFIGVLAPGQPSPFPPGVPTIPDLRTLEPAILALG
ncbi:HAD family hydrolase [Azospirillum sp.]|uniref:HAD family hydrolase n=1 Tax=Azospirillum sp. TaxID=34012 RepID=UPI002D2AD10D|nr:HAD family hydrolase [Azospirillum sp.]HYD71316.1 HAD family hydrolase [Azospirillum sp.]